MALSDLVVRTASVDDVPVLASMHIASCRETYTGYSARRHAGGAFGRKPRVDVGPGDAPAQYPLVLQLSTWQRLIRSSLVLGHAAHNGLQV